MAERWIQDRRRDTWRKQAKEKGYRARSAWKLKQIQKRFELIRPNDVILDVGCHPGGWTQVAVEEVGEGGVVIGIDLEPCQPVEGASILVGDITDTGTQARVLQEIAGRPLNVVVSDIAPDISGNWETDQAVSVDLVAKVFDFALPLLCPGGAFVTKIFQGVGVDELLEVLRPHFSTVRRFSPEASRNSSSEAFVICRNHRPWASPGISVLERWEEAIAASLEKKDADIDLSEVDSHKGFRVVRRSD